MTIPDRTALEAEIARAWKLGPSGVFALVVKHRVESYARGRVEAIGEAAKEAEAYAAANLEAFPEQACAARTVAANIRALKETRDA